MRRFIAAVLVLCFGFLIPTAASPMRVCIDDGDLLQPGFKTYGETATHKVKCCPDCGSKETGDSCCIDIKGLPDATDFSIPIGLPPVYFIESDLEIVVPTCPLMMVQAYDRAAPIRGPDSPGARRALLEIWNI